MAKEFHLRLSTRGWLKFYVMAELVLAFLLWREPVYRDWVVRRAVRTELV